MKKSRSILSIQYRSFFNWSRHILFVFTQVSDFGSHALKGQQHFRIYFKLLPFQGVNSLDFGYPGCRFACPGLSAFGLFRPYPSISETLGFIIVSQLQVTAMMLTCCQMMLSLCRTVAHFVQKWCKVSAETQVYLQSMPNRSPFCAKILNIKHNRKTFRFFCSKWNFHRYLSNGQSFSSSA